MGNPPIEGNGSNGSDSTPTLRLESRTGSGRSAPPPFLKCFTSSDSDRFSSKGPSAAAPDDEAWHQHPPNIRYQVQNLSAMQALTSPHDHVYKDDRNKQPGVINTKPRSTRTRVNQTEH